MEATIYLSLLLCLCFPILLYRVKRKSASSPKLPPGSFGIPIIGQSFAFFRAMRGNKIEEWFQERSRKYRTISKLNLFGTPTVFVHGKAANKFVYTCNDKMLGNEQYKTISQICGKTNLFESSGEDHRRMRGALGSFLKPEALKRSVGKMDEEIQIHLSNHWCDRHQISAMPLMKTLTFDVICSLIFGIERGTRRDTLIQHLQCTLQGILALPIYMPFTRFSRALCARSKINDIVMELIRVKRELLKRQDISENEDLIINMLKMRDESNTTLVSDEEIVDNCIAVMMAGFEATSALLTLLIKLLGENSYIHKNVLNEHEDIRRQKSSNTEPLSWEDLGKMKYTWRVASELLRMNSPVICSTRKVLKDFEFEGFTIPKGWQVMWSGCMTHMDESIFADPLKFDPARFENPGTIPSYGFIPFGAGPRMCPGYEFTRIETLVTIHYLVTRFQWHLSLKENLFARDPTPVFYNGLPISVEIRKPASKH